MITKDSLIEERESVNETVFKIRQRYSNSPSANTVFVVVEGRDDITYYGTKAEYHIPQGWKVSVIPAGNRKKVIETYYQLDWNICSKSKVFFIVDRDLSDYTGEDTPIDENVYVTDNYAIENDVCTFGTFLKTLKYFAALNDINEDDENELMNFYLQLEQLFYNIATPIMGLILYWKKNSIKANYANVNFNNIFEIRNNTLFLKSNFSNIIDVLKYVCIQSGVPYDKTINLEPYIQELKEKFDPIHYVRGKYIACFFVAIINYTAKYSKNIIPSKIEGKLSISIGSKDMTTKLCGIMDVPSSLFTFLQKLSFVA